jgi:acetylornithine deacetylase/succinyl-diaminopimelate desuccinylase-like protein
MDYPVSKGVPENLLPHVADHVDRIRDFLESFDDWVLDRQMELTSIPAPPFHETTRGIRMAELMEEVGLVAVGADGEGNVRGWLPATGAPRDSLAGAGQSDCQDPLPGPAPLVISAHLDTVFPPGTNVSVVVEGERILAPGISDDGRGLAALLATAKAFSSLQLPLSRPVLFVATVGEEGPGNLRGVRHLFRPGQEASRASGFISLDGVGMDRIIHRGVGSTRLRITLQGPGGHSWMDFGLCNPIHALGGIVSRAAAIPLPEPPQTSLTIARWGGGTSINAIPREAWIEVDMRSEGANELGALEDELRRICAEEVGHGADSTTRGDGLELRIDDLGRRPAGSTEASNRLVQAAVEATRKLGQEPKLIASSTDANLPMSLGIPAVTLGAGGRGGKVHTVEEWFENENGPEGILRAVLTVLLFR